MEMYMEMRMINQAKSRLSSMVNFNVRAVERKKPTVVKTQLKLAKIFAAELLSTNEMFPVSVSNASQPPF